MEKLLLMTTIAFATMAAAPAASTGTQMAAAQPAANAPKQAKEVDANGAPAAEEKKICKLLPSSYSHRSDRVCLTKAEWAQVDEDRGD